MRRTKKQLLGLAGLAVVGVMTAIAYCLPTPNAAAEGSPAPSASNGTSVTVTVRSDAKNYVRMTSPEDGAVVEEPIFAVNYLAQETEEVETYIQYDGGTTPTTPELVNTFVPTSNYETNSFDVNLANHGGMSGQYRIIVKSRDFNNVVNEDSVAVTYQPMSSLVEQMPAKNGDPILNTKINSVTNQLVIRAYNSDNQLLFVNAEGQDAPIVLGRDDINPATGMITKVLPFGEYKAKAGRYNVVVSARDASGKTIAMTTLVVNYDPEHPDKPVVPTDPENPDGEPEVPNTGFNLSDLNISKIDYLLTGLVVFGLVSVFAVFLVLRKSRR